MPKKERKRLWGTEPVLSVLVGQREFTVYLTDQIDTQGVKKKKNMWEQRQNVIKGRKMDFQPLSLWSAVCSYLRIYIYTACWRATSQQGRSRGDVTECPIRIAVSNVVIRCYKVSSGALQGFSASLRKSFGKLMLYRNKVFHSPSVFDSRPNTDFCLCIMFGEP